MSGSSVAGHEGVGAHWQSCVRRVDGCRRAGCVMLLGQYPCAACRAHYASTRRLARSCTTISGRPSVLSMRPAAQTCLSCNRRPCVRAPARPRSRVRHDWPISSSTPPLAAGRAPTTVPCTVRVSPTCARASSHQIASGHVGRGKGVACRRGGRGWRVGDDALRLGDDGASDAGRLHVGRAQRLRGRTQVAAEAGQSRRALAPRPWRQQGAFHHARDASVSGLNEAARLKTRRAASCVGEREPTLHNRERFYLATLR